ncbi:MAG TPA: Flp family type IVb pilin [Acetobacteraceae bacterium]|jgi:Flp pilus assembly pilin Flp|nr:Flp family type IVb pilin [Acetobacteraceae bacterium]
MLQLVIARLTVLMGDRRGISAMEYGILAAAIIGVVSLAATNLGNEIGLLFNKVVTDLSNAVSG